MRKELLLYILSVTGLQVTAGSLDLSSPDGSHRITVTVNETDSGVSRVAYSVTFRGCPVVTDSRMGLDLDNRIWEMALGKRTLPQPATWMDTFTMDSVGAFCETDTVWRPLYGERSSVKDHYRGATMYLSRKDGSDYRLNIEVRVYDEGVAFRYFFPEHPAAIFHKVVDDLTEYTFPDGVMAWSEQWAQAPFERLPVDSLTRPVERALTLEYPGGYWAALADADVDDWCLTRFVADADRKSTLKSVMYSPVDIVTYYATPWKVIMAADTPGELLEHNDIILNLNPECEIAGTGWIRPGTIMRETTISTEGALATIDFCAEHRIPYMLFDWKWYEPCTSHDGDATVVVDKLDMPRVTAYARERGVGIWVYVNQHALMKQMDELFPLLHSWGIVGVKSGFVQYASHRWATWLHDMVRKAADNHLMMNIHDEFRPSGFSRTYPNLLTQEGIHGNEEWPDATHNVTLPFTRMINGAADYTICYFDKRLKNTHAHQLAASMVMYSPLQTILWYDTPSRCHGEPEMAWFDNLATSWDDTRVIDGYPGRNITMARRSGDCWWVGAMTNNEARRVEVPLDFLTEGTRYVAYVYTDDPTVDTVTHVRCAEYAVDSRSVMKFNLRGCGGAAMRIVPAAEAEEVKCKRYKGQTL